MSPSCFHLHLFLLLFLHPGQTIDSDLSEIGLQQAEAAGCYLKDVKFHNVFVSSMLRARQVRCFSFTVGVKKEKRNQNMAEKH